MTYSLIGYGIQGILPVGYEVVILGEGFSSPHSYIEGRARFNGFYNTFFTFLLTGFTSFVTASRTRTTVAQWFSNSVQYGD